MQDKRACKTLRIAYFIVARYKSARFDEESVPPPNRQRNITNKLVHAYNKRYHTSTKTNVDEESVLKSLLRRPGARVVDTIVICVGN